jgi:ZIP family zinc transporter
MASAFLWGALAASSLLIGGLVAIRYQLSRRALGLIMAFGAGVLISAVAFDLVLEAHTTAAGSGGVGLGLFLGCGAFFVGELIIDGLGGTDRKAISRAGGHACSAATEPVGSGLAIVLGIILDGIPESAVLGLTILLNGTVSAAFLSAVFLSNLPEAMAATAGLLGSGWSKGRVLGLWLVVMAVSGLAAAAGYGLLQAASNRTVAVVMAFAAGAILTMLADTMMPEAFAHAGRLAGLLTTLGFAVAFLIYLLE